MRESVCSWRQIDGATHLHVGVRPGETGEIAPGAEVDGHGDPMCRLELGMETGTVCS